MANTSLGLGRVSPSIVEAARGMGLTDWQLLRQVELALALPVILTGIRIVVVQNIVSSMFNSHLLDFSQGWLYVLGVGVAGGMVLRNRSAPSVSSPP